MPSIARCITSYKQKKKEQTSFLGEICSFLLYRGLGLALFAFVYTNAMLAFFAICKFSIKDTTLFAQRLF